MRKVLLTIATITLVVSLALLAYACGTTQQEIKGVTFSGDTVTYDGQEHVITVSGTLPEGADVSYSGNKGTNAGTYNATATITCEGYKTLTLNATLIIEKATYDMSNVKWNYTNAFTYDETEHEVKINESALPTGVTVKAYAGNKATDTGEYTASVTFNYDETNYNAPVVAPLTWKINGQNFPTITFNKLDGVVTSGALEVVYNGTEHEVTINVDGQLPDGTKVDYANNKGTNANTYNATVTISKKGYNTVNLTATLVIKKATYDMSGIEWNYTAALTYNGNEREITINESALPSGVTVKAYTGNKAKDVGTYNASVTFNYDTTNYNTPTIDGCQWEIVKADLPNVTMDSKTVEYDALPHSLEIVADLPLDEVTITFYYNDVETDSVIDGGTYNVRCVISGKNYNTKEVTATLTIRSTEEALYSVVTSNGTIYFQNNLHGNKLYRVSGSNVVQVNNDVPNYMIANGNNLYYFSTSLFSSVIKSYNGTTENSLYSAKGEYLATDGKYIYYAINNLLFNKDQNGIYKLDISGSKEPVRLVQDKAAYLTVVGNYVYYSNLSQGKKLYRVSTTASDLETGTLLRTSSADGNDEVSYIITDGTNLYFNSTQSTLSGFVDVAAAIFKYNVSTGAEVKLTTDAGKYLTKVGDYIYYVNSDKITSSLFGKGIYRVSANQTTNNNQAGEKILESDSNVYSSLSSDGNNLYYYKLTNKHFYKNNALGNNEVDLMANFQPVEESTFDTSAYSYVTSHNGEIYYTNPLDGSSLYKYNPTTKKTIKVVADHVSSVTFYTAQDGREYMYYTTYISINYALFRVELNNSSAENQDTEVIKISSSRLENLQFVNDKIYCIRIQVSPLVNYILKMDLDGNNEEKLYSDASVAMLDFVIIGDNIYFGINPRIGDDNVSVTSINDSKTDDKTDLHKATAFVIVDNKIYFYANKEDRKESDNTEANALKVCDLDGKNTITIMRNVDITYMYATDDGKIFFSSQSTQNSGLYVYDTTAQDQPQKISDKPAHGMTYVDGKLYFLQSQVSYNGNYYPTQSTTCDGHLYCYDGEKVEKVA